MPAKVTVLGAGNAGFALASHLGIQGHDVCLYEHPDFAKAIEPVQKAGNLVAVESVKENEGEFKAVVSGTGKIALATSDIKAAIEFAEVVMIIVPAFGQVPIFTLALPHLRDGQVIVSMPGNLAALQYGKILKEQKSAKKLFFVDTDSIPYACRKLTDNQVFISGMKLVLNAGVYPGEATDKILEQVQPLFTLKLQKNANVIEAALKNMNMIVHPPPVLLNAGWIEVTKGKFSFYTDGCSPAVCKVMDKIDEERMKAAELLKLKTEKFIVIDKAWYGDTGKDNTYEHIHFGAFHGFFPAPPNLDNRYINEDVAYVLLPFRDLCRKYSIATPMIDALVLLAETMLEKRLVAQRGFDLVAIEGEPIDKMHERLQKYLL